MSKKTELIADLQRIGYQLGGAHLTQEAREVTFNAFASAMRELSYGIRSAAQIGGRHIKAFVELRLEEGISARTCANQMSHMRAVLEEVGKEGLARNPEFSNQSLGIGVGSRVGTKEALSDEALRHFQERTIELGRASIGCVLELQRTLGLRAAEAIRAGNVQVLSRWQRELEKSGSIHVVEGTKGGRSREVHPSDLERAQHSLSRAINVLKSTGQRYLVSRAGSASTSGLKQAMSVYRNLCHREGIQSHSARYAFAKERIEAYRDQGYSRREARAATSQDLGHGDGRGRYVASVYVRGK